MILFMTQTPISQLNFYPGNARRGDIGLIAESLERLGQYKPVVVCTGETEVPRVLFLGVCLDFYYFLARVTLAKF